MNNVFNASTTVLASNAVFTGPAMVVKNASVPATPRTVSVSFFSDQASAANGAVIQGYDGAAWIPLAQGSLVANTPLVLTTPVTTARVRVVLTNGATLQTKLSINVSLQD